MHFESPLDKPGPDVTALAHVCARQVKPDNVGDAALVTIKLTNKGANAKHIAGTFTVNNCPQAGCWPPPPPPQPTEKVILMYQKWSSPTTWRNTTDHYNNPLNKIENDEAASSAAGRPIFKLVKTQQWPEGVPSEFSNVWIPQVCLCVVACSRVYMYIFSVVQALMLFVLDTQEVGR